MRIHIVAGPGSGKTTVAEDLAASTGIPVFSLDEVAYRVQGSAVRPLEDRQRIVKEIASRKEWITEGVYLWWTDELLSAADVVLWLDPRWRVALWRIVVRHIRKSIAGSYAFSGVRQLLHFLRFARMYYTAATPVRSAAPDDDKSTTRAATRETLDPYAHKVRHCRTGREVRSILVKLGAN